MNVSGLPGRKLASLLGGEGLPVRIGPFNVVIRSAPREMSALIHHLYGLYSLVQPEALIDMHVEVAWTRALRRWIRPQVQFLVDGRSPFTPYALDHAFPALEWGINWCIATRAHHFLMLHSAVVERDGLAILFPAAPGCGKSTLCTALIHSGWRLMSDEFGLVRPDDGALVPIPRLIPLKNESIDVIRRFRPEAIIGPSFLGTRKGTVAHVRPPSESILCAETARPRWLVFPRWVAGVPLSLQPLPKSQAFLGVATNAFNYEVLDETAFRLVADMVEACDCYTLTYSDLDEAMAAFDRLFDGAHV